MPYRGATRLYFPRKDGHGHVMESRRAHPSGDPRQRGSSRVCQNMILQAPATTVQAPKRSGCPKRTSQEWLPVCTMRDTSVDLNVGQYSLTAYFADPGRAGLSAFGRNLPFRVVILARQLYMGAALKPAFTTRTQNG
jgi:hypothetical protein